MSTHNTARPLTAELMAAELAEVIELPGIDAPSFYQRNSGSLPKSEEGMADAHRRTQLPTPDNTDPETLVDKIKNLFAR